MIVQELREGENGFLVSQDCQLIYRCFMGSEVWGLVDEFKESTTTEYLSSEMWTAQELNKILDFLE